MAIVAKKARSHRSPRQQRGDRWPDLAPIYAVQYRRTGHAVIFAEEDRDEAVRLVAAAPADRRLVVARWRPTQP